MLLPLDLKQFFSSTYKIVQDSLNVQDLDECIF
jgi:hypothetical protein